MKLAVYKSTGGQNVPHDVKFMRMENMQYHRSKGQPVIHKHRWNLRDLREGRAQRCPLWDDTISSDHQWDYYCFGTGFLGGYDDGKILYVTIADTVEDVVRFSQGGVVTQTRTPGMTAPWYPDLGDGDLIITAQFGTNSWDVIDTYDRYELQEVTPTTLRGFGRRVQARGSAGEYKIAQACQIDKLPDTHAAYQVPVVFDYSDVPDPDPNVDPSDYPVGSQFSSRSVGIRIRGREIEEFSSSYSQAIRLAAQGSGSSISAGIRIAGQAQGPHIYL